MRRMIGMALTIVAVTALTPSPQARQASKGGAAGALPVIVFETAKGNFEMEMYPGEAPKSVEHILTLVRRNFYNGLRVHRVVAGFVVQFGDPQTRDMTKRDRWGSGGSGRAIGVAEFSAKRPHKLGAVALAHSGDAKGADSQMYICINSDTGRYAPPFTPRAMNGSYTVIGQVISGMDVVQKLQEPDVIRRATVKGQASPAKR